MGKCLECKYSYIDFGNCLKKECNPCEEEVRANERAKVIEEFTNAMIEMMPGHKQDILHIAKQLNLAK